MEADDFRRYHLAEWPTDPCAQLAHETWHKYDDEATARERWYGPRGRLNSPRMSDYGLPPEAQGGFGRLFLWLCKESYEDAQKLGFGGGPAEWQRKVKNEGKRYA